MRCADRTGCAKPDLGDRRWICGGKWNCPSGCAGSRSRARRIRWKHCRLPGWALVRWTKVPGIHDRIATMDRVLEGSAASSRECRNCSRPVDGYNAIDSAVARGIDKLPHDVLHRLDGHDVRRLGSGNHDCWISCPRRGRNRRNHPGRLVGGGAGLRSRGSRHRLSVVDPETRYRKSPVAHVNSYRQPSQFCGGVRQGEAEARIDDPFVRMTTLSTTHRTDV